MIKLTYKGKELGYLEQTVVKLIDESKTSSIEVSFDLFYAFDFKVTDDGLEVAYLPYEVFLSWDALVEAGVRYIDHYLIGPKMEASEYRSSKILITEDNEVYPVLKTTFVNEHIPELNKKVRYYISDDVSFRSENITAVPQLINAIVRDHNSVLEQILANYKGFYPFKSISVSALKIARKYKIATPYTFLSYNERILGYFKIFTDDTLEILPEPKIKNVGYVQIIDGNIFTLHDIGGWKIAWVDYPYELPWIDWLNQLKPEHDSIVIYKDSVRALPSWALEGSTTMFPTIVMQESHIETFTKEELSAFKSFITKRVVQSNKSRFASFITKAAARKAKILKDLWKIANLPDIETLFNKLEESTALTKVIEEYNLLDQLLVIYKKLKDN